jgi:predicted Rossmann-fold nucleotide-binding protein
LIYGGGAVGLMGAIVDEVLHLGGDVIGYYQKNWPELKLAIKV